LFDLRADPGQVHDLFTGESDCLEAAWKAAEELVQWHMRSAERTLSGSFLHPERGLVQARDTWR
jgi:hypothetical protein